MYATVRRSVFGCEFGGAEGVGEVEGVKRGREICGLLEGRVWELEREGQCTIGHDEI